jgi:hypothetical protein
MAFTQSSYPRIHNMRAYAAGRLVTRPGTALVNTGGVLATPLHSVRRLNDPIPGVTNAFTRVVGAGTALYAGPAGTLTQYDTGYSGNPLSLVSYRPDMSPEPFMYVMDSSKASKIRADGTLFNFGGAPPLKAPTPDLAAPNTKIIDTGNATAGWANSGTAGALSSVSRFSTTTDVAAYSGGVLYDSGTTGWACVKPAAFTSGISPRALVIINSGGGTQETVEITEVNPAITSTTIASIVSDNAALVGGPSGTGPSSIVLTAPANALTGLQRNALVKIDSELVRVLAVITGPGNVVSFRCSTTFSHAAGSSVTGVASFRAYFANNHVGGETLAINVVQSTVTAGIGNIDKSITIDLSTIGTQPTDADDYLHVSISMDVSANLVEGRVYLDYDSATNDFAHNASYLSFRQNDLQAAVATTITTVTAVQQAIQNQQIAQASAGPRPVRSDYNYKGGAADYQADLRAWLAAGGATGQSSTQADTGGAQWSELLIPLGQLQRIGTDTSRTLANVVKVRVQLNVTANVVLQFGAILIRGGYGPDVGQIGNPISYRYRGRSSTTGAKSNPSPPTRYGLMPRRDQITVTMTQHPDAQFDKLDVYRFGGALTATLPTGTAFWAYVGTTANVASPSFADTYLDSDIANAPALEFDNFQPFVDIDITRSGTCVVAGTSVEYVSGAAFNVNWAAGTEIVIGNQLYHLYTQPGSTLFLELAESAGAPNGGAPSGVVAFFLMEPPLLGQTLPVMWGPWNGMFFACGSAYQPGYLFGTKPNNPDSAPDAYQWEVSSPSEPTMGGIIWGPLAFACTTQRTFQLVPSADTSRVIELQEVPGAGGLWSRWAICAGDVICKLEVDGIYAVVGGTHESLTAPALSLIFGHDGQAGQNVTLGTLTFYAVDMTNTSNLRLSWENNHLIFNYLDLSGTRRRIWYSWIFKIWGVDTLPFGSVYDYQEEGQSINSVLVCGADGNLYQSTGTLDGAAKVAGEVRMPWMGSLPKFMHGRDGYLGLVAAANCNLVVNADGTDNTVVIAAPTNYAKIYIPLPPVKGRVLEWAFNSTDSFELYLGDCKFNLKPWGDPGQFQPLNPFALLLGA